MSKSPEAIPRIQRLPPLLKKQGESNLRFVIRQVLNIPGMEQALGAKIFGYTGDFMLQSRILEVMGYKPNQVMFVTTMRHMIPREIRKLVAQKDYRPGKHAFSLYPIQTIRDNLAVLIDMGLVGFQPDGLMPIHDMFFKLKNW